MFNKRNTGLLLAGLAAYAFYRYNRLSAAEKKEMTDRWKDKGKKIYDQYMPDTVKHWFEKEKTNGKMPAEAQAYTF